MEDQSTRKTKARTLANERHSIAYIINTSSYLIINHIHPYQLIISLQCFHQFLQDKVDTGGELIVKCSTLLRRGYTLAILSNLASFSLWKVRLVVYINYLYAIQKQNKRLPLTFWTNERANLSPETSFSFSTILFVRKYQSEQLHTKPTNKNKHPNKNNTMKTKI